uniref:Phosphoribosyl pyrophosphate synthetase-associated protein 1 n=1 Tax=Astyanax mexicanus TaxID=7994 RepID=A0A8B9GWH8_ASTMX
SVRGQTIFIIQTIPRDVNTAIMEMLVMAYALKTSCAKNIIGVIPYFPYSKQCKMRKRGSIVCKLLASMLAKAGLSHIITMDLHQKEIQGFFSFPVDNLRASPFLLQYIQEEVSKHYRQRWMITSHQTKLNCLNLCTRSKAQENRNKTLKNPVVAAQHPVSLKQLLIDDIIDDVEDFVAAAEILKERGAYKIYIMATHGLLSADAPRLIEESAIDEVVVTNTVPHEVQKLQCPKIKTVDVSMILAEAIRRIHNGESMAYLFRNITVDD